MCIHSYTDTHMCVYTGIYFSLPFSKISDMQLCHVLHCFITDPGLEVNIEIRHTTGSGVFTMAWNLKHLEYLKYHNPETSQTPTKLQWIMQMVHLIQLLTKNTVKISHLVFDCSIHVKKGEIRVFTWPNFFQKRI